MCQLVLLGVRTALSFREGYCLSQTTRKSVLLAGESGAVVPLLASTAVAPWQPCHASASFTLSHSRDREIWRVLSIPRVRHVTQDREVPDHQVLHVSGEPGGGGGGAGSGHFCKPPMAMPLPDPKNI